MPRREYLEWIGVNDHPNVMETWEFVDLVVNGELAGVAALQGTEIHFVVAPTWRNRAIQKRRAQEFLAPLMDRVGFLTTRSLAGDAISARFLRRMGFEPTWRNGDMDHWMLSAPPFSKGI